MRDAESYTYRGWQDLRDLFCFAYGFIPISATCDKFFAVDGRMNLKEEMALVRALSDSRLAKIIQTVPRKRLNKQMDPGESR